MQTVFSHIVQQRLSQESENVATTALAFVLESHETVRSGMMKLLRGIIPDAPARLWFRTQYADGSSRPDMAGNDDEGSLRVFIENKFWAGLTDHQPVSYLGSFGCEACRKGPLIAPECPQTRREGREGGCGGVGGG